MRYLISGGAGFIGSHLCESLLAQDHEVTVIDNFDPFYPRQFKEENLAGIRNHRNFKLIEADICQGDLLKNLTDPFDCLIHLAAKAGVRQSLRDPYVYQSANVLGTQNLLELARASKTPQFVFASSSSVYGVNPKTPWAEDDNVLLPISPYASTKISGELLGHVYSHLYGIRFVALRFFSVYGPRQRPDLAVRKFTELILQGRPIPVYGDGSSSRDYTYVDDVVAGVLSAVKYRASMYEIINLGNHRALPLTEVIGTLEMSLKRRAVLSVQPSQPGDVAFTCADIRKAKALLNYEPKTAFVDGTERFINWLTSGRSGGNAISPAKASTPPESLVPAG